MGSPAVVMSSPRKSPSTMRRTNKPLVEKKRRARINGCLGQLKSLILSAMKTEGTQVSRLEKADILEMTVKYLRHIQRQQATSSVTSEPEVVAKFSAGYSECAAEVIRYMDSVTGVTPDVRYRLESHLVGRLQGSMADSGVNRVAPPRPDAKPPQIQSQPPDETSLHYQTALELANMASSVKAVETLREDHSNSDMASRQSGQQPKVPGSVVSYQREAQPSSDRIPVVTSFQNQDQVFVRPKTISPVDISNCTSISTSVSSLSSHRGGDDRQTTIVATASALAPFNNEDGQLCENRNEYFNTAPTPPDTPPFNNNDINNNDVTSSATSGYIYLKEREVYINQAGYGNPNIPPASPMDRNIEMASRDESHAHGRDYVIKHGSNSFVAKDINVEMKTELDRSDSESDSCLPNSAMTYDSCHRNYNLAIYQQPLHIHIPDSPTPTTPSPPLLFPSHAFHEQQPMVYNHPASTLQQRNNSNAILPTILYGVRGNDAPVISGAIDFRSEQTAHPLPTNASKAKDDFHSHSQSTCNLDETNCSNTTDSRSQSQIPIFKQSTWPVAIEHAQNSQFQGHSNEQLSQSHSQPQPQRSPSSSPLSPPTLTREDLRPSSTRASIESERALEYFDYNDHRRSLCRTRRNSHDNSNTVSSSRRLTFDENAKDVQTNEMSAETVAFYRRERDFQLLYSRSGESEQNFRSHQDENLNINYKDRICSPPSPCVSSCRSLHEEHPSPPSTPLPSHPLHHARHLSSEEHYSCYSQRTQVTKHQFYRCKNPHCKDEQFSSSFTPFRRRSSSSSSQTNSSPSSSPPTIVPSHVLAYSQDGEGMRSLYQETQANSNRHVNSTTGHRLQHNHNNNMNGPPMSQARDLSRQNVSPLSSPTLKRVMMGHGSEVSARPRCTDARPAESSLQRTGGQPGVRGQGFAILRRVPQDTPVPIERVPHPIELFERVHTPIERATIGERSLQATQTTTSEFTEERLWRPW